MFKFFSTSLLALGAMCAMSVAAASSISGTVQTTADASGWQVKYLGGENICVLNSCRPDETFAWADERRYTNGTLDYGDGYKQAVSVPVAGAQNGVKIWNPNIPWIGTDILAYDKNGYYSYATTFSEGFSGQFNSDQMITFEALTITYNADDHVHAIFINGVQYDGSVFLPGSNDERYRNWSLAPVTVVLSDIANWNVFGDNTVEFIVHNNNSLNSDSTSSVIYNTKTNATGLSAVFQASYQVTTIPEPETCVMMLAGLAMIGAVARRRRNMSV